MSLKSAADGTWAPFGGFNSAAHAVHCNLPQLFPLHRRRVAAWLPGDSRSSKRQHARRVQDKLFNEVIDGLNWYSGRALDTAFAANRGAAASAIREQAESRLAGIVDRQSPPLTRQLQQQPSESYCVAGMPTPVWAPADRTSRPTAQPSSLVCLSPSMTLRRSPLW